MIDATRLYLLIMIGLIFIIVAILLFVIFIFIAIIRFDISKDLKLHLSESKKKLKLRLLPLFFFSVTSNAIAAGTFYFGVCVTTTAIQKLNENEQFAVLDHELGHIVSWKNELIYFLYIISLPILFIVLFVCFLYTRSIMCLYILLPFITLFLIFRICFLKKIVGYSHDSEFMADKISAELGNSDALISALIKIEKHYQEKPHLNSISKIFDIVRWFYISNHPPHPLTSERIKKVKEYK